MIGAFESISISGHADMPPALLLVQRSRRGHDAITPSQNEISHDAHSPASGISSELTSSCPQASRCQLLLPSIICAMPTHKRLPSRVGRRFHMPQIADADYAYFYRRFAMTKPRHAQDFSRHTARVNAASRFFHARHYVI